jgi:5'-3' exonuclease
MGHTMGITLLLADALNLIRRVYAAQPGEDGPERAHRALQAGIQSLHRALRECQPTHAACIFDGQGPSWRHQLYEGYKAGRPPMPEALQVSLPKFKAAFSNLGVPSLDVPKLEADDVIATVATKMASRNGQVVILSNDKLFFQLLSERITVRDHFQKQELDHTHVREKFGVEPEQLVDYLALSGDSTNNIRGVPGVGSKTAAKLLAEFGTLDGVLAAAKGIKGTLGTTLQTHADEARRARSLVHLRADIPVGVNLTSLRCRPQGGPR